MRDDWQTVQVKDVASVVSGGTPKSKVSEYWDGGVQWITPKDMGKLRSVYVSETSRTISELGLGKSSAKLFPEDSVILSTRAPIGHLAINTVPMATNQGCRALIPSKSVTTKFLFYFLKTNVSLLNDLGTGTTFKELAKSKLEEVALPLPPLAEQQRIVAILDKAFEGIDQAIANTEQNLASARELFESYLNNIFTQRGDGWVEKTLGEFIDDGLIVSHLDGNHGGDYPRKHEFIESGVPYIAANCIRNGEVDFSLAKYLSPERAGKLRKGIAQNDDVLFAHNATVGPVAILRTNEDKVILGTSLTYYRCDQSRIHPVYLASYLKSPHFVKQYTQVMRQSTRNQVPITKQREFTLIVPPVEFQLSVVDKISELQLKVGKIEALYTKKLESLKELKQSLLQQAFAGELTKEAVA